MIKHPHWLYGGANNVMRINDVGVTTPCIHLLLGSASLIGISYLAIVKPEIEHKYISACNLNPRQRVNIHIGKYCHRNREIVFKVLLLNLSHIYI